MKIIVAFIVISFCLGCKETKEKSGLSTSTITPEEKNCMQQILEKDSILGSIRNLSSENISLTETIKNYTDSLKTLDFTRCPEQFKTAFQNHIVAWLNVTVVTDQYPDMRGEMHDLFSNLEKSEDSTAFKELVKSVWDTWGKVEEYSN